MRNKRAFTLIELLVVVVVIVILMSITFRISSVGEDSTARNRTVNRMQRLENCLSGYYAAYGSYPPVKVHGSRNFRVHVENGMQKLGALNLNTGERAAPTLDNGNLIWDNVKAACQSQPIGFEFPFKSQNEQDYVKHVFERLVELHNSSESEYKAYRENQQLAVGAKALIPSMINDKSDYDEWADVQIFKFGVLSYLLPRYLLVLGGDREQDAFFMNQDQWGTNNELPCELETGQPYQRWDVVNNVARESKWRIAALPSQTICLRWLPNLAGQLCGGLGRKINVYDIQIIDTNWDTSPPNISAVRPNPRIYYVDPSSGSTPYTTNGISMLDGWGNEFYYYSAPPYQSYRVWSAGKNKCTFPPWVTSEDLAELKDKTVYGTKALGNDHELTVSECMADDITSMSH